MVLTDNEDEDKLDSSEVHGHVTAIIEDVNNAAKGRFGIYCSNDCTSYVLASFSFAA